MLFPHLVEGGLTDAVVHNPEPLLVAFNLTEDGRPRYACPGELVADCTLRGREGKREREGGRERKREEREMRQLHRINQKWLSPAVHSTEDKLHHRYSVGIFSNDLVFFEENGSGKHLVHEVVQSGGIKGVEDEHISTGCLTIVFPAF